MDTMGILEKVKVFSRSVERWEDYFEKEKFGGLRFLKLFVVMLNLQQEFNF